MVGYILSYKECCSFHEVIISKIMLNKRESENWASSGRTYKTKSRKLIYYILYLDG
jgi:hypothetical protein